MILHRHWLGPKLSLSTICKRLYVGLITERHWVQVYDEPGDVQETTRSGSPKITSPQEDEVIKNMVLSQPESSSQIISTKIKFMKISISSS